MTTVVHIDGYIDFAPNIGVLVNESALELAPVELARILAIAWEHMDDPFLNDACCGGQGPLADLGDLSLDDYLYHRAEAEKKARTAVAKREYTAIRRREFVANRADLVLQLIDVGVLYVCGWGGGGQCPVATELTVDHTIPISRGGTDALENLRFLCRSHNSLKGAAMEVVETAWQSP